MSKNINNPYYPIADNTCWFTSREAFWITVALAAFFIPLISVMLFSAIVVTP